MGVNIDTICQLIILPLIRYPVIISLIFSYWTGTQIPKLQGLLLIYAILINVVIEYNNRAKVRGPWIWLKDLSNPVCVLTGGSCGLGQEILERLLLQFPNLTIVVVDLIEPPNIEKRVKFYKVDLSDLDAVDYVTKSILGDYGHVDVLINCAGMRTRYQGFLDNKLEEIEKAFRVNVFAPILFMKQLAPKPVTDTDVENSRQFYVVTVGSALGVVSPARISGYSSTKSALIAFHNSWTHELLNNGVTNIRTLLVLPGQLNTRMFNSFKPPRQFFAPIVESEELARKIVDYCGIGKRGEICVPLYVYFTHALSAMPFSVTNVIRYLSQMDSCLPDNGN